MAIKIYRPATTASVIVENLDNNSKTSYQAVQPVDDGTGKYTLYGILGTRILLNGGQTFLLSEILDDFSNPYTSYEALVIAVGFSKANGGSGGSISSVNFTAPLTNLGTLTDPNGGFAPQPDGNYALSFLGGTVTFVPIQGETVGSYKAFAHTTIPANYLFCNGAIVNIATYPNLFAVIGNDYGGDGITTFGIPDLQGRFIKGDSGADIATINGLNTLSINQLPQHTPILNVSTNTGGHNTILPGDNLVSTTGGSAGRADIYNTDTTNTIPLAGFDVIGANQPHEHPHVVARIAICFESVGLNEASPTQSFNATLAVDNDSNIRALFNGLPYLISDDLLMPNFIIVKTLADLPAPSLNIISIPTKTTLFFPSEINLGDNQLFFAPNCAIIGSSSETAKITSSLGDNMPLIFSEGSLSIQNISLQSIPLSVGDAPVIFKLDGISTVNSAIDCNFVNIIDSNAGIIQNYLNVIFLNCAFIGSTDGISFNGDFDSIVFEGCIFRNGISGTCINVKESAVINRRLRIENTPFVVLPGQIGIDISTSATINTEGYIAKFVNFSGGGTYLQGVQPNDNKALFLECRGVSNSASITELYMINNTIPTNIPNTFTFYKVSGITSSGIDIQRFTNTNNRATYTGALTKYFNVSATLSANSGNNHLIVVRIAKNGVTIPSSESQATTSASGRSENIKSQTIVQLSTDDYIEVFVQNQSTTANVTVSELNLIITPLN